MIFLIANKHERLKWGEVPQTHRHLLVPGFHAYFAVNEKATFLLQRINIGGGCLHIFNVLPQSPFKLGLSVTKHLLGLNYIREGCFELIEQKQRKMETENCSFAYYPSGHHIEIRIQKDLEIIVLECKEKTVENMSLIAPVISKYAKAYQNRDKQAIVSKAYPTPFDMRLIIEGIMNSKLTKGYEAQFQVCAQLNQLVSEMIRQIRIFASVHEENDPIKSQILAAQNYICAQIDKKLFIEELSALFYFSKSTFQRQFKKYTGTDVGQFIIKEKIARAQELLRTTRMTVAEIAFSLSYEHPTALNKAFKK